MTDSKLREAIEYAANYLDDIEANMLRNDADMMMDRSEAPTSVAEKLRAVLSEAGEIEPEPIKLLRAIKRELESSESLDTDTWRWIGRVLHYFDKDQGEGPVGGGSSGGMPQDAATGEGPHDAYASNGAPVNSASGSAPAPTAKCPNPECRDGIVWKNNGPNGTVEDCPYCTGQKDAP